MTESRVDLLNWLNATLDLNYTRVEQLGTGAAYCQIIDTIYLDLPMGKVKFNATKDYEYLNNFKILQSSFVRHKINKTIPVEKLIKCKFQDNLEFFQWIRKFWKENKDESEYDPNARRKYIPPASNATAPSSVRSVPSAHARASSTVSSRRSVSGSSNLTAALPRSRSRITSQDSLGSKPSSRVTSTNSGAELQQELKNTKLELNKNLEELEEYKQAVEALETERNFYFNKLREIEILSESTNELLKTDDEANSTSLKDVIGKIQEILYSTEEGFQVPQENEVQDINMEEETF